MGGLLQYRACVVLTRGFRAEPEIPAPPPRKPPPLRNSTIAPWVLEPWTHGEHPPTLRHTLVQR